MIQPLALQRDQAYRKIRRIEVEHNGRQRSRWQSAQVGHGQIRDVADGGVSICARLKVDLDEADAGHRAGFDVVDVAAERKEALIAIW